MLYPIQNDVRNRLDLSGIWDFKTDPEQVGARDGWYNSLTEARPIAVPGSWNEQYEDLFNYLGLAWYVKRTYVPSSWQGQRVFIRVGSANYYGTVYVNGEQVGSHEGGHQAIGRPLARPTKETDHLFLESPLLKVTLYR